MCAREPTGTGKEAVDYWKTIREAAIFTQSLSCSQNHNRSFSVVSTRLQLLTLSWWEPSARSGSTLQRRSTLGFQCSFSAVLLLSSSRRHFKQLPVLCPVMEEEREQLCRQDGAGGRKGVWKRLDKTEISQFCWQNYVFQFSKLQHLVKTNLPPEQTTNRKIFFIHWSC